MQIQIKGQSQYLILIFFNIRHIFAISITFSESKSWILMKIIGYIQMVGIYEWVQNGTEVSALLSVIIPSKMHSVGQIKLLIQK